MPKKITVFTTNSCAYCVMVKRYLGAKGQNYEEINLDEHPERQAEALPVTVVTKQDDSREVVVGYNLTKLVPAIS
jgi:glutaredoxin